MQGFFFFNTPEIKNIRIGELRRRREKNKIYHDHY